MGWQAAATLALLLAMLVALARDLIPAAVAVLGAAVGLLLLGVVTPEQAFAGFASPAPWTVAALYVVAAAVRATGALDTVVARVLGTPSDAGYANAGRSLRWQLVRLLPPVGLASGLLNNTTIVAMVAPRVTSWAAQHGRPASLLLMPLSFVAILGGLLTAIGTSTTLVVSGLLEHAGREPIGMFEITAVGGPLLLVGLVLLLGFAPLVLPRRECGARTSGPARRFTVGMRVRPGGKWDGALAGDAALRGLSDTELIRIDGGVRAERSTGGHAGSGLGQRLLRSGDVLVFAGSIDAVVELQRTSGLEPTSGAHPTTVVPTRQRYFEAVVGPTSKLVGAVADEFERHVGSQAAVLGIHRDGEVIDRPADDALLHPADTLLLVGDETFARRTRDSSELLVVAEVAGQPPRRDKSAVVLAVVAALLVGAATPLISVLQAALAAALAVVGLRVLSPGEARDAIDLDVIVVIAAAFGIGEAMTASGLADGIADLLLAASAPVGPFGTLVVVMVVTIVLTELVTNNAAAVLVFPIAVVLADSTGVDLRPLAMAVAVAASASFLTPIGYQTNTMVLRPGGYRFADFARLGLPVTAAVVLLGATVIPVVWAL